MEQDVENEYRTVCSTCLSSDRDLFALNNINVPQAFQIFKLLMYDFAGDRLGEMAEISHLICWECLALMKRFHKFKWQVHNAQEHIRVLALSQEACIPQTMDHTYMSQSLSTLVVHTKSDYDKIFFDYTIPDCQYIVSDGLDVKNEQFVSLKDTIGMDVEEHILEVPEIVLDSSSQVFSHVVLGANTLVSSTDAFGNVKSETMPSLTITPMTAANLEAGTVILSQQSCKPEVESKPGYTTEYMSEGDMLASREEAKKKVSYASSVYKCELCAIGFYTQQQVEQHFETQHRPKPGLVACKLCYLYIEESSLASHVRKHYMRYRCKMCSHTEYSERLMQMHTKAHLVKSVPNAVIKIEGSDAKKVLAALNIFANGTKQRKSGKSILWNMSQASISTFLREVTDALNNRDVLLKYIKFPTSNQGRETVINEFMDKFRFPGIIGCIKNTHVNIVTAVDHRGKYFNKLGRHSLNVLISKKKKNAKQSTEEPPKPGDLRKLLSKTTIEGYKCLECDMFFKNSRARKNHVARFHREGLQCDHCKKRFVNRTTLATHLRLHEGPLPREECPICHKLVRSIQLKYHIQRHENKSRYECTDCNKVFSHLATYHAHLKFSRAHADDNVFKFPCPMCNKGYPTKEAMQDHFNYQHLGKTAHKCPICDKPIASRANVEKHIARVHAERKPRARNHQCQSCGKAFTDKKALTQHEVIHSGARPLSCDICQQTFKQKASLYTHRKRVHKVYPAKKQVHYMNELPSAS